MGFVSKTWVFFSSNFQIFKFKTYKVSIIPGTQVPAGGKFQMLAYIACVEAASEMGKPHYLNGGDFVK